MATERSGGGSGLKNYLLSIMLVSGLLSLLPFFLVEKISKSSPAYDASSLGEQNIDNDNDLVTIANTRRRAST